MANVSQKAKKAKRKRIINANECKSDLNQHLKLLFEGFWRAVKYYENEIAFTPFHARGRGMEASYLNSKIIQSMQEVFQGDWKFGKYKRFMLRLNGYIVFFKKLNRKNMPMNIQTRLSSSIQNQEQGKLFDECDNGAEPIIFFGYNKNQFGEIVNPRLVYIDEDKVRFTITENELSFRNERALTSPPAVKKLTLRDKLNKREGTSN